MPAKIINLIKLIYTKGLRMPSNSRAKLLNPFEWSGLLSPIIDIDEWGGLMDRLEDNDFADNLCLMFQTWNNMNVEAWWTPYSRNKTGLKTNPNKIKEMKIYTRNNKQLVMNEILIEQLNQFQYLGSMVSKTWGI